MLPYADVYRRMLTYAMLHIDFEYILGNDPKPFAPPMRLSEQMVMAMGGRRYSVYLLYWYNSTHFTCFMVQ